MAGTTCGAIPHRSEAANEQSTIFAPAIAPFAAQTVAVDNNTVHTFCLKQ